MNMSEIELYEALQRNPVLKVHNGGQAHIIQEQKKIKTKYGNERVKEGHLKFDSKKERTRYHELKVMLRQGYITDLKLQETFILQQAYTTTDGERIRAITYTADFTYKQLGEKIIEDVKGRQTERFKIAWKMMKEKYPQYVYKIT